MALKFFLDANLPKALARASARHAVHLDVLRAPDVGLAEAGDPEILEFAAKEGRITVSRDKKTMRDFAAERIRAMKSMPGLLVVRPAFLHRNAGIATLVAELKLIAEASNAEEWEGVIQFIPFLYA